MQKIIYAFIKKFYPIQKTVTISEDLVESQNEIDTEKIINQLLDIKPIEIGSDVFFMDYEHVVKQGKIIGFGIVSDYNEIKFSYEIYQKDSIFTKSIAAKDVNTSLENLLEGIKQTFLEDNPTPSV